MRGAQRELEFRRDVEEQLADTQSEVATLRERLAGQRDTQERLVIRAPVPGRIVDLSFHTLGGVVKPGDRILDIVPQEDALIIEARVSPQYIDRLHVGLTADVHFDAYANLMNRPLIKGQIEVLSADTLTDPQTRQTYYTMRVSVPETEIHKLGDIHLVPGMLATVMVKTGERSLAVYLLRPLLRRFASAMKE
jgi:HlyD family type I secretion membrane fusion protein